MAYLSPVKLLRFLTCLCALFFSCSPVQKNDPSLPVIGFLDFVEDATLARARAGFYDALKNGGFSEDEKNIRIIYSNAQGDIPTLGQAADFLISKKVDLIAANTTLATITAVQRTKDIPVCMMVAPHPDLAGLTDSSGRAPANLFGVYETLEYIDSAVMVIHSLRPFTRRIGTIYNHSEPQSRMAFDRLKAQCQKFSWELISLPVNNSSESQMVTAALLMKKPDVFFALPDNVIFASFETIVNLCNEASVPVFTSEAGLTARGAVASYGADFYRWGYQAGLQAAAFLKNRKKNVPASEPVAVRIKMLNSNAASRFGIVADSTFVILQ